jgi:hypothetical protein
MFKHVQEQDLLREQLVMRKLIISNFVTLDGFYESKNKTFDAFLITITPITQAIRALITTTPNACGQPIR